MRMLWVLATKELRDGLRNRWIAAAIIVLGALALRTAAMQAHLTYRQTLRPSLRMQWLGGPC